MEFSEAIASRIERATGKKPSAIQMKMAQVPAGATLLDAGDLWFPLVIVENVHVFPGIPELLRKKFESARDRFRGVPFVLKRVYVTQMESEIAEHLNSLLEQFPQLMLGSYPRIQDESFRVMLTLESRDVAGHGPIAYENGSYTMVVRDAAGESRDRGKYLFVLRKGNGQWRYEYAIWNSDLPKPVVTEAAAD